MTSTGKTVAVTSGQPPYLVDAAFGANGARVAAWSWGNVIGVWDVVSGRQITSLKGHTDGVTAVAFTPSASRLVSASFDGTVRVWDLAQGRQIAALEVPGGAWALAGSSDGRWIAAGAPDGTIRVWNGAQLDLAWSARLNGSAIRALAFSPDSRMLASGARDIRIWDSATGAGLSVVRAHRGTTEALAFGADGLRLVSSGDDQTLRVTNLAELDLRVVGRHGKPATVVAFAPDNESLVSAAEDRTVRTWRATTARLIRTMEVPGAVKTTLWDWPWFSLSRDGRLAASWVEDDTAVYVWDTTTGERLRTLAAHQGGVERWEFTADGRRLVVASGNGQVRTWDIATGGLVGAVVAQSARVLAPLHSPGRMLILTKEGRAQLLDLEPFRLGRTLGSVARGSEDDGPTCAAVREGDDAVVVGTGSGSLSFLELRPGAQARVLKASGPTVTSCAYSPGGRRVAAAFADGTIGLWDTNTLEHLVNLTLESTFVSPKKPGVAVSLDYLPGISGVHPAEPINYAASIAFSPDGSKLATAWADGAVRIWNASAKSTSQRARDLVDTRFGTFAFADDVVSAFEAEPDLAPEVRAEAIRQARMHVDDPSALNSAAWRIVRAMDEPAAAYTRALRLAQKAGAIRPTAEALRTLGVAQYRSGAYREAVATLEKGAALQGKPGAADLAFLAMAHQRLGRRDAALAALEKLRAEMKKPDNASDEGLMAFLREAEALGAPSKAR
jgi:WD40 repeat protein